MDIVEYLRGLRFSSADSNINAAVVNGKLDEAADEIERLREDKAELLKALTNLYESCRWEKVCPTIDAAKDVIAKATGGE
jgi:uncharacterized protein (UPF0335 family)